MPTVFHFIGLVRAFGGRSWKPIACKALSLINSQLCNGTMGGVGTIPACNHNWAMQPLHCLSAVVSTRVAKKADTKVAQNIRKNDQTLKKRASQEIPGKHFINPKKEQKNRSDRPEKNKHDMK